MLNISSDEVRRWRVEIEQAEKFKEDEFGKSEDKVIKGVAENIHYFEKGYSSRFLAEYGKRDIFIPLNITFPIVKNVIPSLYYKNPYIVAIPKRKQDEDSAPYVSALSNYYFRELNVKEVNQRGIFDAYVLGLGVCKIGYATQFGSDIPDKETQARREKGRIQKLKEFLRLSKPKEEIELPQNIEPNEFIRAESPYIIWISPFDFGIDPNARSIYEANYVYEKIRTTVDRVKNNKNYKNTKDLQGIDLEPDFVKNIPPTEIEKFKPIELYEVHYKTDEGINILVLAKDQDEYLALRHDKSIYEMDGFQYELLAFNKHGHKLYPISEIDVMKGLQDRINLTFENILDQVDRFMTKLAVDYTGLAEDGERALRDGQLGSIVKTNRNPNDVFKEISLTQVKGDLVMIIDKLIDVICLVTGITKAMLTGLTSAETATEAQIGQAGQNLRLSDKADLVADFSNRQARKLWQVIKQFVDLEEIELITGDSAYDDITGTPRFSWLKPIDSNLKEKLIKGEYEFQIEVGSTQKPDLPILRKQVENLVNILGGKGVLEAFQMQGYKIELAEILKKYLLLFPDVFNNIGRIIKPIEPGMKGLLPIQQPMPQQGGGGVGNIPQQFQEAPPNMADIMSEIGGEKGGQIPIA